MSEETKCLIIVKEGAAYAQKIEPNEPKWEYDPHDDIGFSLWEESEYLPWQSRQDAHPLIPVHPDYADKVKNGDIVSIKIQGHYLYKGEIITRHADYDKNEMIILPNGNVEQVDILGLQGMIYAIPIPEKVEATGLDLNKLDKEITEALEKETPESLKAWLDSKKVEEPSEKHSYSFSSREELKAALESFKNMSITSDAFIEKYLKYPVTNK